MAFEVVCCLALGDAVACDFLMPITKHPMVSRIWVIRTKKIECYDVQKFTYKLVPTRFKPWRFIQMMWICFRLASRNEVRAFVSFNPIPYGLIELLGAIWFKKPVHFGFIGDDWYIHTQSRWGRWLLSIYKHVAFITATGESMRKEIIDAGINAENVAVLPHSIALDRYIIADPQPAYYTCIFIGYLIRRKRADLILRAFAAVHQTHPQAKLCIVGNGPLEADLKALAAQLGITEAVDFVGFVPNVQPYVANSKIMVMASDVEGLPFALVEGISSGLVPILTPVGTIGDLIVHEENGLLFPRDDWSALAQCIQRLLDNPELYERLRLEILKLRESFSYDKATAVWDKWLNNLASS